MSTIWAFDLGKGSIGEAVWDDGNGDSSKAKFLHVASLLIPAEFASTKDAASRRRMKRTRDAHKAREAWLDEVWTKARLKLPQKRVVLPIGEYCEWPRKKKGNGKWQKPKIKGGQWGLAQEADEWLEREFAKKGDPTCYTSCLLRIKLLRGEELEDWQIYKALRSAIQKRGYGKVPWAAKEAARSGKTAEEVEELEKKELLKKDPKFQEAIGSWKSFADAVAEEHRLPAYFDAHCMGLWPTNSPSPLKRSSPVRFERSAVEYEIIQLGDKAALAIPAIQHAFDEVRRTGVLLTDTVAGKTKHGLEYSGQRVRRLAVLAETFGEFLCHGPSGCPHAGFGREEWAQRDNWVIEIVEHPDPEKIGKTNHVMYGGPIDQMAGVGQKIPRFDNRIIASCALIPALGVCKLAPRYEEDSNKVKRLEPRSLLAAEVTFLIQLKNQEVKEKDTGKVRFVTAHEMDSLLKDVTAKAQSKADEHQWKGPWQAKVLDAYRLTRADWRAWLKKSGLGSVSGDEERESKETTDADTDTSKSDHVVRAPKTGGRSRFCRPALSILKYLLLSNESPDQFRSRLGSGEESLLAELGLKVLEGDQRKGPIKDGITKLIQSDLAFLEDVWKPMKVNNAVQPYAPHQVRIPDMALRYLREHHGLDNKPYHDLLVAAGNDQMPIEQAKAKEQIKARGNAIIELIREQRNPIVRDRLHRFWERLKTLQSSEALSGGIAQDPGIVTLEFVRDDKDASMEGQHRTKQLLAAMTAREKRRDDARKALVASGRTPTSDLIVKQMLFEDQGCCCIYSCKGIGCTELENCEIEHIVPRSKGGPDAYWNWVLADPDENAQKGERVPYQWFRDELPPERWSEYQRRILAADRAKKLGRRKVELLLSPDAAELVGSKYTALADTAWVARLAQSIVRLHFGWSLDDESGKERVMTISGGLTARIRRKYMLDSLLGRGEEADGHRAKVDEVLAKLEKLRGVADKTEDQRGERDELREKLQALAAEAGKERKDHRHHALDAMVLAFLPNWARDQAKEDFFRFTAIGDTEPYASSMRPQINQMMAKVRELEATISRDVDLIRNAKDKNDASIVELRRSLVEPRKQIAEKQRMMRKMMQPRNIAAVRQWFREQLDAFTPDKKVRRIQPVCVSREAAEAKLTLYRRVFLVRSEGSAKKGKISLTEFPFLPVDTAEGLRPDYKWLCARILSITKNDKLYTRFLLCRKKTGSLWIAAKKWHSLQRTETVDAERRQWVECMEEARVTKGFIEKKRGKNNGFPAIESCEVAVCQVDVVPSERTEVFELAYSKGETLIYNPAHLMEKSQKLLRKLDVPKVKGKPQPATAQAPDSAATTDEDCWPGFVKDTELIAKLQSDEFIALVHSQLRPYLPGINPGRSGTPEAKARYKADNETFKEKLEAFAKEHKLPGYIFAHDPALERAPRKANLPLMKLLFEPKDKVFSVDSLRGALKKNTPICDPVTVEWLAGIAATLGRMDNSIEQEAAWKSLCKVMRSLRLKSNIIPFRARCPIPTVVDWLQLFDEVKGSRPRIAKINITTGGLGVTNPGETIGKYRDFSKDRTGQFAEGDNHGYLIATKDGKAEAHPIRFFQTYDEVKQSLLRDGWSLKDKKPWRRGELLYLPKRTGTTQKSIDEGFYFLGSIQNGDQMNFKACFGEKVPSAISVNQLVSNGLRRVSKAALQSSL